MSDSEFKTDSHGPFTVAQIAIALGQSRQSVERALRHTEPNGRISNNLSRGHLASAWHIKSLPSRIVQGLAERAARKNYREPEQLLSEAPKRWEAPIPLAQIEPACRQRARRLQTALRTALALQGDVTLTNKERFQRGYSAFCKVMGNLSEKQFKRLLVRTIERDAGWQSWDDEALYLAENPAPAKKLNAAPEPHNDAQRKVLEYLARVEDPQNPTIEDRLDIWLAACEVIESLIKAGEPEKAARGNVVNFLAASHVQLGRSKTAVAATLKRKHREWVKAGKVFTALRDRRPSSSGWHRNPGIPEEDRLKLIGHAVLNRGGRVSQAYRDLYRDGELSDAITSRHLANPENKSYVPHSIREAVSSDVARLENIHHGPRKHKLDGAYHTRDWSDVAAGDWYQADDVTAPVYFWTETGNGIEMMRGQLLPFIDVRTTKILGFVLLTARNYDSMTIRSLITRVCTEHGLPRRGFYFERGIWASSKILTGSKSAVPWEVADRGLRALGLEFRHARLPRGKVIENTIGKLQNRMEGLPGYCGRQEQTEKFERMEQLKRDVEAGRIPADEAFLSETQLLEQYDAIMRDFNNEVQGGSMIPGLSPAEAWEGLQSTPRARFDSRCQHLLAHDRRKVKIGSNGITITIGKQRFNYKGQETGQRRGEEVLAWFNPEIPDSLACTDLDGEQVFTVQRSYPLPAMDASAEEIARENGLVADHQGHAKALYRVIKNTLRDDCFRANIVDRNTARVGGEIAAQRQQLETTRRAELRQTGRLEEIASRVGLPTQAITSRTAEAERGLEMMMKAFQEADAPNAESESLNP